MLTLAGGRHWNGLAGLMGADTCGALLGKLHTRGGAERRTPGRLERDA